jgi:glycine cleavage system H protein
VVSKIHAGEQSPRPKVKLKGQLMANVPEDLHYSKDHEWVRVDGGNAIIGITDYAQNSLGDVVYVELPKAGENFSANESFGSVESVKAVSEMFIPVSGSVVEANEVLSDEPEKVNADPYGEGWMISVRMSNPGEVDRLLTAAEYEDFTKAETE